jgi:hypothetical protein
MTQEPWMSKWPGPCSADRMVDDYNFAHFERRHLVEDARRTWQGTGVRPGAAAPDFMLPLVDGGDFTLSRHRHRPVLLRFGSYT